MESTDGTQHRQRHIWTGLIGIAVILLSVHVAYAADIVIFLTSDAAGDCGNNCYTLPTDWTDTNTIEAIGAGGGGRVGSTAGAGGGAGGAYSVLSNLSGLTPGGQITFQVGSTTANGAKGGDTYFDRTSGSSFICDTGTMSVCGKGGLGSTSLTGAATTSKSANVPSNAGADGGKGGDGVGTADVGGGGGGAGGPHGNGQGGGKGSTGSTNAAGGGGGGADGGWSGASGGTSTTGGNGGNNRNVTGHGTGGTSTTNSTAGTTGGGGGGGGGATAHHAGSAGGDGEVLWTATVGGATAGPGGGGGGAGGVASSNESTEHGGNGGGYGGGGGGSELSQAGHGTGGIIIITYTPAVAPTVTTQSASSVTDTTAQLNGTITATGGQNAVTVGFAWGTDSTMKTNTATTTNSGSFGAGTFNDTSVTFVCNTAYYSRAYATNTNGDTGLGSISGPFTTSACAVMPTVTTNFANPGSDSAILNGTMTVGDSATQHGFAYGTNTGLSGGDTATTSDGALGGNDSFTRLVASLLTTTTYYFRAYATNGSVTGYGLIRNFTTGDITLTRRIRLFASGIIKFLNGKLLFNQK